MKIEQGNIVLVPFPFTNLKESKVRPALVLYNEQISGDSILAPITSHQSSKKLINLMKSDITEGDLPTNSFIKYTKLSTLEKSLVIKVCDKVSNQKLKQVLDKVIHLFQF